RAPLPRHVTNGLRVVRRPHGRARVEHDPGHDRQQPSAQGRAGGRHRVRRSPGAVHRLGPRGRASAGALSSRARSRPRRLRPPRRPADLDRAIAGITALACAAAIVAASIGPFWRIRDVSIEGAHHVTVDALVDAAMKLARLSPQDLRADATSPRVVLTSGSNGLVLRVGGGTGWEIRFGGAERIDDKIALVKRYLRDNPQRKLDYVDVRTPD